MYHLNTNLFFFGPDAGWFGWPAKSSRLIIPFVIYVTSKLLFVFSRLTFPETWQSL